MIESTLVKATPAQVLKAALLALLSVLALLGNMAYAQAPVISNVSPGTGYSGQSTPIEIVGSNFGTSPGSVTFNGTPVTSYSYWGANTIVPFIPSGATTGALVVTNSAGASGSWNNFIISSSASITSVSPTSVEPGGALTITGTNLIGCSEVLVVVAGDTPSTTSGNTITAWVANNAIAGPTTVLALCDGVATNQLPVTILPPPTLNSVSPVGGYPGTVLTISGTGLQTCTTASINWTVLPDNATATSISMTLPTQTAAGPIPIWAICGTYETDAIEFLVHMHYDNGTVALTVNGVTDSVPYGLTNTTSGAMASSLISAVNADPNAYVTASANGSTGISLSSKDPGAVADFNYSIVDNYDTWDFSGPSFAFTPSSGTLAGASNAIVTTGVPVYCYSITTQPGSCASLTPETTANNGYDADGNVASYSDNLMGTANSVMGTWTFGYDPLNRLTSATASKAIANGNLDYCWVYDQFGNRLGQYGSNMAFTSGSTTCQPAVEANLTTNIATYNSSNQMLSSNASGNLITPVYDASGDTTADGTNVYLYDAEGRVCAMRAVASGVIVGYLYDAGGNRVAKGTISSLSCDMNPADTTTYNGFALTAQYLLGPGGEQLTELNSTGAWVHTNVTANGSLIATFDNDNKGAHFFLTDWLGTKRVQTNYLGSAVAEYTWTSLPYGDAFSSQLGASEQHYTGKERDTESGNDYFKARYFGSNMGRFLSPDPTGGRLANPQSLNKYAYVLNNPQIYTDPTGLYACKDDARGATEHCTSDNDKRFEASRQHDLQSKNKDVVRGAAAYGHPGKANGVTVGFADLGKAGEGGVTHSNLSSDDAGHPTAVSDVTINSNSRGTALDADVGHEGSHVADAQDVAASISYTSTTFKVGDDISQYRSEQRAYGVTDYIYRQANEAFNGCGNASCALGAGSSPIGISGRIDAILLANPGIYHGPDGRPLTPSSPGANVLNIVVPK